MEKLKIGKINFKNRIFLAPMVDVTDLPYRMICRKAGAGMAYTEMLYLDAINHTNPKTQRLMMKGQNEKPVGIQVTGNSLDEMKKTIESGVFSNFDLVDINCGCPSVRITGTHAGSFLLKNPEKIAEMIRALKLKRYIVTAKIRLGFNKNNVMKVAKIVENAGADALTIHARLATDGSDVKADWKWIKKVKDSIKIPVIGNGDVFSGKDAKKMLEICDGVMIARATIGDPDIFYRINFYLKTGKEKKFDFKRNFKYFKEYLNLAKKYNIIDLPRIKYIGSKFLRNKEGVSKLRNELMQKKTFEEIEKFANSI